MPDARSLELIRVEQDAQALCNSVQEAAAAGVPDALLLPALMAVFRDAGMLPDIDFASLLGMLK